MAGHEWLIMQFVCGSIQYFYFRALTAGGTPIVDSRAGTQHASFSAAV